MINDPTDNFDRACERIETPINHRAGIHPLPLDRR